MRGLAPEASRADAPLAGRYRLGEELGRGASAALHRGVDLRLGREVAIKHMHAAGSTARLRARFLDEARTLATLRHPHLVTVFDAGEDDGGRPYLVMELLEGAPLDGVLAAEAPIDPARALRWAFPLLGALAVAHDHGVLHRDIKPANVFLERRGEVEVPVLIDFGIAQREDGARRTTPGAVVGTPAYMAPEQVRGERLDPAADVWGLGVLLFEALAGRLPFRAATPYALLLEIARVEAPPLAEVAPAVPAPLALAIDRALRPRARREPDARSFARALLEGALAAGVPVPDAPDPRGLPEWARWREEARALDATAELASAGRAGGEDPPSAPRAAEGAPSDPGAPRSELERSEPGASRSELERSEPGASRSELERSEPAASRSDLERSEPAASRHDVRPSEPAAPRSDLEPPAPRDDAARGSDASARAAASAPERSEGPSRARGLRALGLGGGALLAAVLGGVVVISVRAVPPRNADAPSESAPRMGGGDASAQDPSARSPERARDERRAAAGPAKGPELPFFGHPPGAVAPPPRSRELRESAPAAASPSDAAPTEPPTVRGSSRPPAASPAPARPAPDAVHRSRSGRPTRRALPRGDVAAPSAAARPAAPSAAARPAAPSAAVRPAPRDEPAPPPSPEILTSWER